MIVFCFRMIVNEKKVIQLHLCLICLLRMSLGWLNLLVRGKLKLQVADLRLRTTRNTPMTWDLWEMFISTNMCPSYDCFSFFALSQTHDDKIRKTVSNQQKTSPYSDLGSIRILGSLRKHACQLLERRLLQPPGPLHTDKRWKTWESGTVRL